MHRRASAGLRYRVGDNLAALRRARGLNQLELAARYGCANHVISKIENGRRNTTRATLEMLASATTAVSPTCCAGGRSGPSKSRSLVRPILPHALLFKRNRPMLILSRRPNESVRIGPDIQVTVLGIKGNQIRLGITAPKDVVVDREEVHKRKQHEGRP